MTYPSSSDQRINTVWHEVGSILSGDDFGFSPELTTTALRIINTGADHLATALQYARSLSVPSADGVASLFTHQYAGIASLHTAHTALLADIDRRWALADLDVTHVVAVRECLQRAVDGLQQAMIALLHAQVAVCAGQR